MTHLGDWRIKGLAKTHGICCFLGTCWLLAAVARAEPVGVGDPFGTRLSAPSTQHPEVVQAQARFDKQDIEGALTLLRNAYVRYGESHPRVMLARMYFAANKRAEGRDQLEQAVVQEPNHPEPYLVCADLAYAERRYVDGALLFERAGQAASEFGGSEDTTRRYRIHAAAGNAAVAEKQFLWHKARRWLEEWIKLDASNATAHKKLGRALFAVGLRKEAYGELEAAVKLDATMPPAAITFGRLYGETGDEESAMKWMDHAVRKEPNSARAHLGVGQWLWERGRVAEAKAYADQAVKLDENLADAELLRGVVAYYLKDFPVAESCFESVYLKYPANFTSGNYLALSLVAQEDEAKRQRALELAEVNKERDPDNAEATATLGWIYYQLGRNDEAETTLREMVDKGTVSADAAYYLAKVIEDKGAVDELKSLLQIALASRGYFVHRDEARQWLAQLTGGAK